MKINNINFLFPAIIIFLSFCLGIYFYPSFPDLVATHWGASGQVDGYSSKSFGLFFLPGLLIFLLALFLFLPQTDPYKKNFNQFKKYFENFINIIFAFLFYIYILTIIWNTGHSFNMVQLIAPGFAVLFYYAGVLTQNTKRNWFVGVRTPWTLSNEQVWEKTHIVAAKLFKIVALLSLFTVIFPQYGIFFMLAPIIFVSLFVFVYSYIEYKRLAK